MRRMWLWVLLYAIGAGIIMLVMGLFMGLGFDEGLHPTATSVFAFDIGEIALLVGMCAPLVGFWVFVVGIIFLLIRGKSGVGRVVSLIGIGFYYVAALGIVLTASMLWVLCGSSPDCFLYLIVFAIVAACIVLPGIYITRKFRQLQEVEDIKD
jgi:hypothetical protein